jgi:hypothetical protein
LSGALLLSGKTKPLFLKAKPVSFSLGTPAWQKLQFRPVCLAKIGVASAFSVANINAKAMGAATKAPPIGIDVNLRRPWSAKQCASTFFLGPAPVEMDGGANLQLAWPWHKRDCAPKIA